MSHIIILTITKTCPCNIQRFFSCKIKNFTRIFFYIFAQNIDYGYMLEPPRRRLAEAVLTSTNNLCFGTKIRKIGSFCTPQFYYIKAGFKGYTFHGHAFLMQGPGESLFVCHDTGILIIGIKRHITANEHAI